MCATGDWGADVPCRMCKAIHNSGGDYSEHWTAVMGKQINCFEK